MEKKIKHLKEHCIVCGYGRVGKNVVKSLQEEGKDVVIVEKKEDLVKDLTGQGFMAVEGTVEEEDLEKAGIKIFTGAGQMTVKEALEAYKNNELKEP